MEIYRFSNGRKPERLERLEKPAETGYLWVDLIREDASGWEKEVAAVTGVPIYEQHVIDSLNHAHPSFYDNTEGYDMVIFQGLSDHSGPLEFASHPTAFFLMKGLLVTVRPKRSVSAVKIKERFADGIGRVPHRPVGLLHQILSAMVDRFMALRDPLARQFEQWQEQLLDPTNPFDNWFELMQQKNRLRKLERLCEEQQDAIIAWRDGTDVELDSSLTVRFNDVLEHIRRVLAQAQHLQGEIESLVQIHFSAVAHRTNEIVRILTVLAAVFLPLTFLAGIFGMNFENMPELKYPYAYFIVLGAMAVLAAGLLLTFKKKRWL